jgi:predicted DNA-binding protein with PD1-like motif
VVEPAVSGDVSDLDTSTIDLGRTTPLPATERSPTMRTQNLDVAGASTTVLIFEKGDDPVAGIAEFARDEHLTAAHLTGIGAFSDLVVGYFDRDRKGYQRIRIDEQVEVLSLVGDIAVGPEREPQAHIHVVVGKSDGSAHGGHLLEAHVWPTLEIVLTESPTELRKRIDPETGLALISPDNI